MAQSATGPEHFHVVEVDAVLEFGSRHREEERAPATELCCVTCAVRFDHDDRAHCRSGDAGHRLTRTLLRSRTTFEALDEHHWSATKEPRLITSRRGRRSDHDDTLRSTIRPPCFADRVGIAGRIV